VDGPAGQMRKRYLVLALVLAVLAFAAATYARLQNTIERMFGGAENVAVVARPQRVEAYRIGPLPAAIFWQNAKFSDYPEIAGPLVLPEDVAAEAADALLSPRTYMLDATKSCVPHYGVKLSFIRGSGRVDVLVCYECLILWVGRDGQAVGGGNFDYGEAELVEAAKAAFPGDAEIQGL
jgi:hypothetical protein